jgi:sulfur relay (sulfurtransferase) complex TusBCD TusD component (DsrE family)
MAYVPPIKKRQYINAMSKERDGKVIAHTCSKCREEFQVKQKGIWFERSDQRDVWVWVCKACCEKRGIRCE